MPTKYIINATIECFLIIFIFMLMMMVFREMRAQGKLVKSDKILLSIFSVNVVGLGFDIVSYFVDNQTESLFVVMNRICIFVSFAYGAVLMLLFSYYVFALIEEEGGEKNRLLKQFVGLVCLVDLGILTVTQFTLDGYSGGLYYFDSSNKYMRGAYYSSHYFLIGVVFLITVVWLVAQKKVLSDTLLHSMIIACVAVVLGGVLQIATDGIAFIQIGNAVAVLAFFGGYEKNRNEIILHQRQLNHELQNAVLLSQIQPHFIFNALTTIQTLTVKSPETAYEAIDYFSDFLRGSMASLESGKPIPFEEDLKTAMGYLEIEKLRFRDSINVVMQIREKDFKVPPLTIQPIVENAVRHGIRGKSPAKGTISISTYRADGVCVLEISDDGCGFDPDKIYSDGKLHVGVKNVRERVEKIHGGKYNIESTPGEGTTVTIRIPADVEDVWQE